MSIIEKLFNITEKRNIPIDATFELTYRCNLNCIHCYLKDERTRDSDIEKRELSLEEIMSILDQLCEAGCLFLTLTGGEILLRKDFFQIAEYARQKGFSLVLFTNGTLIDSQKAQKIKELSPAEVHISIYSASSKIHDSITGVEGSFEKTKYGITELKRRGIHVILKSVIMRGNVKGYEEIIELADNLKVPYRFDPLITPLNSGGQAPCAYRIDEGEMENLCKDKRLTGISDSDESDGIVKRNIDKPWDFICSAGRNICNISPYGDIYPCLQFQVKVGNLRNEPFSQIWANGLKKIRNIEMDDLEICRDCPLLSYCSRCPGLALLENGSMFGPSSICCTMARVQKKISESVKQ